MCFLRWNSSDEKKTVPWKIPEYLNWISIVKKSMPQESSGIDISNGFAVPILSRFDAKIPIKKPFPRNIPGKIPGKFLGHQILDA